MKVVIKDLPASLEEEAFVEYVKAKHHVNRISFLKTGQRFRRISFVDVPATECRAFIRYHNNSYYKKMKIRCELHKSIVFNGSPAEELLKRCGKVAAVDLKGDRTRVLFSKVYPDQVFTEIESKALEVSEGPSGEEKRTAEYFNTLFFDFDKVLGSRPKSELLSSDAGPRFAYLEAELVNQTKSFLESNSIYLDSLTGERSRTALLVRDFNVSDLPTCCETSIAPSQTIALLKFKTEKEALVHARKFEKAEFLPLSTRPEKRELGSHKLIVKNVPFQAEASELRRLFQTKARIRTVRIPIKRNKQSRGFAFVECETQEDALKILEWFGTSTHLYGRRLVIEPSA